MEPRLWVCWYQQIVKRFCHQTYGEPKWLCYSDYKIYVDICILCLTLVIDIMGIVTES